MKFSHNKFHLTNMKLIIAITCFGIWTCAFASYVPYMSEKCLEVKPMKTFRPAKFFKETWYVTQAKNGTVATVCHKYKAKKERSGNLVFDYGYYDNGNGDPFFQVHCRETKRKGTKQFSFKCELIKGQESSNFKQYSVDLTFIDTDYDNYAIFYRCVPIPKMGYADNFLVLQRKIKSKKSDAINKRIKQILFKKQSVCLSDFIDRKNSNCKKNSNF
uniref:Putative salivary lipocalin n=1 Tax=Triatoma infestans TaxID=30076 RepID=A0A023FAN3_TRIIF